jgi:hypothetical protein
MTELVHGRPGWRLEPRTTPGASPLWCFVVDGEVEFSVTAEDGLIRMYIMATDRELLFRNADELTMWLQVHRQDALKDAPKRPDGKRRIKKMFEWN